MQRYKKSVICHSTITDFILIYSWVESKGKCNITKND